ncbi:MAG: D-aminoacyl-tRNA deacylase [Clostridiales bacterium]|nr:D-aminoacyl-tRNA deacylase [Clostridiales bacterium]
MRAVVTRVKSASVEIDGKTVGKTDGGFLVLLGVKTGDTEAEAEKLVSKICQLRVFEDGEGKMNRSLADVGGSLLVISQFTLYADCRKGNRPSFISAARPDTAVPLYELFIKGCRDRGFHVETGEFGANMQVASVNDGPVTIIYDTDAL